MKVESFRVDHMNSWQNTNHNKNWPKASVKRGRATAYRAHKLDSKYVRVLKVFLKSIQSDSYYFFQTSCHFLRAMSISTSHFGGKKKQKEG